MDLQCEIKDDSLHCIKSTRILQRCELQTINGKRADQVNTAQLLHYKGSTIHYLPSGLHKFFPQLKHLIICKCRLKEITSNDLFGLKNLITFDVNSNDLESLPDDLFIHTRKLKSISFMNNKLEFVSSRLFDPIPENQLTCVTFQGNRKINAFFHLRGICGALKTLGELKTVIDSSNSAPLNPSTRNCLAKSTLTNYEKLWDLKHLSDFTVIVGSKEIPVHKIVLASQSSVFASIFWNGKRLRAINKLEIKGCGKKYEKVVAEFLRSLYTGNIKNKEDALGLFILARTFDVDQNKVACEDAAIAQLNQDNAMDALKVGNLHKSEKIIDAAFGKIKKMLPYKLDEELKGNPEKVEEVLKNFMTFKTLLERAETIIGKS